MRCIKGLFPCIITLYTTIRMSSLPLTVINILFEAIEFIVLASPFWLPVALVLLFWRMWVYYIRSDFIANMKWVMLEIRLPKEINKSPAAMELVIQELHQTFGEANLIEKYWKGGVRPWHSLELVSIEGRVHFFVRMLKGSQKGFESALYAQYPDVEVHEVSDYTRMMHYEGDGEWKLWGCEFKLTKADPYPIKTYVDYGLDKDPKEEFKIDPMTPTLEFLGSLDKGEQVWLQILLRAHKKEDPKKGAWFEKTDAWADDAKEEIKKIIKDAVPEGVEDAKPSLQNVTPRKKDVIAALERSVSKVPFDVGIRGIYLAQKDVFSPSRIGGVIGSVKQYSSNDLNGFKPSNTTGVSYPWQDFRGMRVRTKKRLLFDAFRRRSWFHPPYKQKHFVLNTEEIATMYHLPGGVAQTPTFRRIESRKAEPPIGLPIGE